MLLTLINAVDKLSVCIVKSCIECREQCIPHSGSRTRVVPDCNNWNEHVKHDKDPFAYLGGGQGGLAPPPLKLVKV